MARERPSLADLKPKPRNDAYTVLLTISLGAMIAACLLLWYDLKSYGDKLQPPSTFAPPARQQQPPPVDDALPPIVPPDAGGAPPAGNPPTPPANP